MSQHVTNRQEAGGAHTLSPTRMVPESTRPKASKAEASGREYCLVTLSMSGPLVSHASIALPARELRSPEYECVTLVRAASTGFGTTFTSCSRSKCQHTSHHKPTSGTHHFDDAREIAKELAEHQLEQRLGVQLELSRR